MTKCKGGCYMFAKEKGNRNVRRQNKTPKNKV